MAIGSMSKGDRGWCFGKWDVRQAACSKCYAPVRMRCEETTKRLKAASAEPDGTAVDDETGRQKTNEHFLKLLEGKLDRRVKWGVPIVMNHFCQGDKLLVFVAQNLETGKIKLKTEKRDACYCLTSIELAEELAKVVLREVGL